MTRTYAKPNDIVACPQVCRPVVIGKIYSQDYYGPAADEGWQIEFEDTDGNYRAWKQRSDGGNLIMTGTKGNPYKDYLTHQELQTKISDAIKEDDDEALQRWNDALEDFESVVFAVPDRSAWVATTCNVCSDYHAVELRDIIAEKYWECYYCSREARRRFDDTDTEFELDPYRNYNALVARRDAAMLEDDDDY